MTRLIGRVRQQLCPLFSIIAVAHLVQNAYAMEDGAASWAAESSCQDEGGDRLCAYVATGALTCEADFCPSCVNAHQCDLTCSFGDCAPPPPPPPLAPCEDAGGDALCAYVVAGVLTCEVDFCPSCINAHQCDLTCGGFGLCAPLLPVSPPPDTSPSPAPVESGSPPPNTSPPPAPVESGSPPPDTSPPPALSDSERGEERLKWVGIGILGIFVFVGLYICIQCRRCDKEEQRLQAQETPEQTSLRHKRDFEAFQKKRKPAGRRSAMCVANAVPTHFDIWNNTPGVKYLESTEAAEMVSPQEALELLRIVGGHASIQAHSLSDTALLDQTARAALMRHVDESAWEGNPDLLLHLTEDALESLIGALHITRLVTFFGTQPNEFRLRRVVANVIAPRCIYSGHSKRHNSWVYLCAYVLKRMLFRSRHSVPHRLCSQDYAGSIPTFAYAGSPPWTIQIPLNDEHEYDGGYLVFATEEGLVVPSRAPGSATLHTSGSVHGVTKMHRGVRYSLYLALVPGGGQDVGLQHLVAPTQVHLDFLKRAIRLLDQLTDEHLLMHVYEYHTFLRKRAYDNQLRPNFAVELVWRAHLLSPIEYATDCAAILGRKEPTVVPHIPLPACEYTHACRESTCNISVEDSNKCQGRSIPTEWHSKLAMKARRGRKFMEQIVSMGDISQATIEDAVSQYVQFLQHVSAEDLNTHQDVDQSNPRKPSLLVDLVWHTHQFYPQDYSQDCVRIGGQVFDHIEDSDSDNDNNREHY